MKINREEANKLWSDGKFDSEIAERFNCLEKAVYEWRKRNNLLNNSVIARSKKRLVNHERMIKLWENGLIDSEIAKELKCAIITVWRFRDENGMGSNVGILEWKERKVNGKAKRV